ncbi:MAG: hypothetical protein J5621_04375, partial [Paludibacteraceae bacterium]|nr:hypothetical protein [Paludibacteraceae bacterium]
GVPTQTEPSAFAQNDSRGVQPYLYNGKEFVETPSNEYNVYDYGFRGYYATIGRFTSIDPLCEQTPWQSPYSYAGNNFINCIDYMGLMGIGRSSTSFSRGRDICQYIVYDGRTGRILDWDLDSDDRGIYVYWGEEEWEIGGDRSGLERVGTHWASLTVAELMENGGIIDLNTCREGPAKPLFSRDVECIGKKPASKLTKTAEELFGHLFDGSQRISITPEIGLCFSEKYNGYGVGLNIMSFRLPTVTLQNKWPNFIDFSYIDGEGQLIITQGWTLGPISYEHSFRSYFVPYIGYVSGSEVSKYGIVGIPVPTGDGVQYTNTTVGVPFVNATIEATRTVSSGTPNRHF